MSSQLSIADSWSGREAFYEGRLVNRLRENGRFYHRLVRHYYSFLVPAGANVLEMGCGVGDLLAEVKPSRGIGVDFSAKTVVLARKRHPELEFHVGDVVSWEPPIRKEGNSEIHEGEFDYILLADLINDLPDVQDGFEHLHSFSHPGTRLVINFLNNLWRPVLAIAEWIGAKAPSLPQNWLSTGDVRNLLHLAGWEVIREDHRILWPMRTPILDTFLNRWVAPLIPHCCLTIFLIARPRCLLVSAFKTPHLEGVPGSTHAACDLVPCGKKAPLPQVSDSSSSFQLSTFPPSNYYHPEFTCSVIIPARNEAGNIESSVLRTPELGLRTELIFVEGHSRDNTWQEMERVAEKYRHRNIKRIKQKGVGKGGAVREGFAAASGDLLFILDADLTMPPEELQKFYEVARSGTAEFINGVRLVYPMEHEAMRFLNMVANKFFGLAFSWLLGQQLKDTLCGTKVLFRSDYERLAKNRSYFGEFDPFGDFDLLFGAVKLNLKIMDLPIRYRARSYGETNIRRWRHGLLLLRMVFFAARRLKFL